MHARTRILTLALALGAALPAALHAQEGVGTTPATDSAQYLRARSMVANGQAAAGRALVDSLLRASQPGTAAYAEGLYWRGTLASSATSAERDYRQIVVDYPLSPRVPEALLRLGQLEAARGDRAAALQHFQRINTEHPNSPLHAEASYWIARMQLEANDVNRGCSANADALAHVNASDVELKNRIDYQNQRCRGVAVAAAPATPPASTAPSRASSTPARTTASAATPPVTPAPVTPSPAVAPESSATAPAVPAESSATVTPAPVTPAPVTPAPERATSSEPPTEPTRVTTRTTTTRSTTARATPTTPARTTPRRTETATATTSASRAESTTTTHTTRTTSEAHSFAVQVAAYTSRGPADELAAKLRARGLASHVDGSSAPYRVRIGHFATRPEAAAELARLKAKKIDGFVTEY